MSTKQTEALKLALECLDGVWRGKYNGNAEEAITAIHSALATQPAQQEPVAWMQFRDNAPPIVAPRDLGTPVFLGIRGGLAHDAGEKS